MKLDEVKEHLQEHLSDGLVIIIGSGLSSAEGIPDMRALAEQLKDFVPGKIDDEDKELWSQVHDLLASGENLEEALIKVKVSERLEKVIVDVTYSFISFHEKKIIKEVFNLGRTLRFSRLLPHLLKPNTGIPIITTNYDRLVEVASENVGLAINNTFSGKYISSFNPKESKKSLVRRITQRSKKIILGYADFVSVFKPHGSIDWFLVNNEPVCSALCEFSDKLIITPGINKFRGGYERPFDEHRELSNKAIDTASRFLIIGYGFNDDHLQVHLDRQMEKGKPTVVLTHTISKKFREFVEDKKNIWVICSRSDGDGFTLFVGEKEFHYDAINIWDLEMFVKEVLE